MHPGVRATSPGHPHWRVAQPFEGLLQHRLNRPSVTLPLPAGEPGTIVLQYQLYGRLRHDEIESIIGVMTVKQFLPANGLQLRLTLFRLSGTLPEPQSGCTFTP